jgi:DNA-binding CsgD family transcriptional regulator/tetratricopeptide (TPR) repeat protein
VTAEVDLLVGREPEIGAIETLFDGVEGSHTALIIRGEPGIGKSALLSDASRRAKDRGMVVLRTSGVQSEARMPFAGLHQLLWPLHDQIDALPAPQREAVLAAFGMVDTETPDLFLISLATLNLLSTCAHSSPVVLIADDTQWLDRSTCEVLAFVARRLDSEPIVLLASDRGETESPFESSAPLHLLVGGLDHGSSITLLDRRAVGLAAPVRERLLADAGGNPLALLELPVAWRALAEGAVPPAWLPLTTRLEHAFEARVLGLPAATRSLLLIAALNDGERLSETLEAGSAMVGSELTLREVEPAAAAGLVEIVGGSAYFRHPLVRSAIRQAASISQRHSAHAALADVLSTQPDRAVWHRAASIIGPDDRVAADLEAAAARAQRRRGTAAAVEALERAAELTTDSRGRGRRLLRAAALATELGRHDVVVRLLEEAEALDLGSAEGARLLWIRELIEDRFAEAARVAPIVALADQVRTQGDIELASNILRTVATACWWSAPDQYTRDLVVAAVERLPLPEDDPKLLAMLASADPVRRGSVVIDRASRLHADAGADPEGPRLLSVALSAVGELDLAAQFVAAAIPGLRAQGRLGLLTHALTVQAIAAVYLGRADIAMRSAEEASQLGRDTAQPRLAASALLVKAQILGLRGDRDAAEAIIAEAEHAAGPVLPTPLLAWILLARGAAALGTGMPDDAYQHLRRIFDHSDVAYHLMIRSWAFADFAEAAVHSGHHSDLRMLIEEMEELAAVTQSSVLRAGLAYVRPLVADDQAAEALFQAGLRTEFATWPFLRARTQMAFGAWLRRQRRVVESRPPLRAARDEFDALGLPFWADTARQELRAAGESAIRHGPDQDELTPQELKIASMAAEGLTNREIGRKLYLSHRTVSAHLYRVFPKLGITSRSELGKALTPPSP